MIITIYVLIEGIWQKRRNTYNTIKFLTKIKAKLQKGIEVGFYQEAKLVNSDGQEIWHYYGL